MPKKQDPYLKILHQREDISNVRSPQPHKYNLVYFPKRIQGPYKGFSFQLILILPNGFPQNPPQIFFTDIPYHLNINNKDGRLNATFLSQDWCSFMTFDMIFSEINALLENPDEKSAAYEEIKHVYFSNKIFYLNQINAWKSANRFLTNKNAAPKTQKQIHIKNTKKCKVQQIISFPETIDEFHDNSVKEINKKNKSKPNSVQSISHELQLQLFSPPLKRKGSSPLVIQGSGKRKNAQSNSVHNCSSNKLQSSHFSHQISNQNLNFILVEEQANQNKEKQIKSSKKIINPVNSPIMKLKSNADSAGRQGQKIFKKAKPNEGKQMSSVSEVNTEKQKRRLQSKQTMEIRNLFKQKQSRNRQEKNIGQFSISSIQQKQEEQNNCNLQKHQISIKNQAVSPFQINLRKNHGQFRSPKNTDKQKTTRRMEQSPNGSRATSIHQQKQILSSSIKTIKLAQKLEICEFDSHSINSNLQKLTTLIRALMNECNCLQKMMQSSQSTILKQILQQKLHQQAQFIEKLQKMCAALKNSIVQCLTTEVEEMLQK